MPKNVKPKWVSSSQNKLTHILIPAAVIEHAPLEAVYIFFDTATYDQIEKDVKVGEY